MKMLQLQCIWYNNYISKVPPDVGSAVGGNRSGRYAQYAGGLELALEYVSVKQLGSSRMIGNFCQTATTVKSGIPDNHR